MREAGLSQILVTSTTSLFYLTGYWVEPHERMTPLLVTGEGKLTLFGNEIFGLSSRSELPFVSHKDGQDPVKDLAQAVSPGKLGIDKFWYSKFLIGLMGHRPDVVPVEGSFPVDNSRMYKDEAEAAAMAHASAMNDQVIHAAISALHDGVRENELAALVNREFLARGADCEGTQLVCFGPNGADPHHSGDSTVLKPGDSVIFKDAAGNVFSYAVKETEVLAPTDIEGMVSGDWDLTMFTCTIGGKSRVTVRCERLEAPEE